MVVRKKKKVTKYRGSKTHGGGSMKKRRGAGHRGGRGRAGSFKRGDGKRPSYWKEKKESKFKSHDAIVQTVNVGHLSSMIENLAVQGRATEKSGVFTIDLATLSIGKLLGAGRVHHKMNITVAVASDRAIERIEAAGGSVTQTAPASDAKDEE